MLGGGEWRLGQGWDPRPLRSTPIPTTAIRRLMQLHLSMPNGGRSGEWLAPDSPEEGSLMELHCSTPNSRRQAGGRGRVPSSLAPHPADLWDP